MKQGVLQQTIKVAYTTHHCFKMVYFDNVIIYGLDLGVRVIKLSYGCASVKNRVYESVNVIEGEIRTVLVHIVLWRRVEPVASIFRPPSCIYSRQNLAIGLREAVRLRSSSFSFMNIATKFLEKMVNMASCCLISNLRLLFKSFCVIACTQIP